MSRLGCPRPVPPFAPVAPPHAMGRGRRGGGPPWPCPPGPSGSRWARGVGGREGRGVEAASLRGTRRWVGYDRSSWKARGDPPFGMRSAPRGDRGRLEGRGVSQGAGVRCSGAEDRPRRPRVGEGLPGTPRSGPRPRTGRAAPALEARASRLRRGFLTSPEPKPLPRGDLGLERRGPRGEDPFRGSGARCQAREPRTPFPPRGRSERLSVPSPRGLDPESLRARNRTRRDSAVGLGPSTARTLGEGFRCLLPRGESTFPGSQ